MKRITFFLMITLVAMQSFAANVDRMTAQSKAEAFLKTNAARGKMMAPASIQFVSQRTITQYRIYPMVIIKRTFKLLIS